MIDFLYLLPECDIIHFTDTLSVLLMVGSYKSLDYSAVKLSSLICIGGCQNTITRGSRHHGGSKPNPKDTMPILLERISPR
jgi:hypothetical protein